MGVMLIRTAMNITSHHEYHFFVTKYDELKSILQLIIVVVIVIIIISIVVITLKNTARYDERCQRTWQCCLPLIAWPCRA